MRSVAIGRKNWLFAGSKAGGERAAAIYSVIETCKLNGIEPQAYIADVIQKIAEGWPASRWDELMPWYWYEGQEQIAQATLTSVIGNIPLIMLANSTVATSPPNLSNAENSTTERSKVGQQIIAAWPSSKHFTSWLCVAPGSIGGFLP